MIWYCITNGTQRGPMSENELQALIRDNLLKPEDYVWNESFGSQWRMTRDVPELTTPPELPDVASLNSTTLSNTPLTGVPGNHPVFSRAMHQAWGHMMQVLFRQATFARWMGLAFCVWISIVGLNEPNLAFEILTNLAAPDAALIEKLQTNTTPDALLAGYQEVAFQMADKMRELLTPNVVWTVAALWLIVILVTCWLRARGAFMVMHGWHHPDAPIAQSWAAGSVVARSLFLFRLRYNVLFGALTALILTNFYGSIFAPLTNSAPFEGALAIHGFLLMLGLSLLLTVWFTLAVLTTHFMVPVMYWRRVGVLAAWRVVLAFCRERPAALSTYFTMYVLLLHVLLAAMLIGMCCTCCCLSYLLILPFVNGILYLPATIFFRGLGIEFLRQWRPDLETTGAQP